MKSSIKKKMFIIFGIFALSIVIVLWIMNYYFIDEYYLFNKKRMIVREVENIDKIYIRNDREIITKLIEIENVFGGNFLIFDNETGKVLYTSLYGPIFNRKNSGNMRENQRMLGTLGVVLNNTIFTDEILVEEALSSDRKKQIVLTGILNNGDYLLFVSPVEAISKNIELTSGLYIYTGLAAIIIGLVVAYFISIRITRPVLELTKKAEKMSKLDFSDIKEIKSNDEIGQLSKVMNDLSKKLNISITELNNANAILQEDINKERQLEEMRREFIANVSHELKTPIALIQGFSEGLQDNIVEDEKSKNFYADVIYEEAIKMNKLVKNLLELSKLDSKNDSLVMDNFNFKELIFKNIEKIKTLYQNENLLIEITYNSSSDFVLGDKIKINQVINNLLSNAIKYSDGEHKKVKVKVNDKIDDIERIEVRIFNTSKGIPESELNKIWDRFYKSDKSRNREDGGTGLGLAIVKKILELHKSNFGAMNVEGGVEFYFTLKKV